MIGIVSLAVIFVVVPRLILIPLFDDRIVDLLQEAIDAAVLGLIPQRGPVDTEGNEIVFPADILAWRIEINRGAGLGYRRWNDGKRQRRRTK